MELKLKFFLHILIALSCYGNILSEDVVPPENRVAVSPLAVGGMLQGLLNMQIRPEGGFYEEKYKKIFKDDTDSMQPMPYESVMHFSVEDIADFDEKYDAREILSSDGKLLKESIQGKSPNPCFDEDKVTKNRLLGLMCSLKILNEFQHHRLKLGTHQKHH